MKNKRISSLIEWSIAIILILLCYKTSYYSNGSPTPIGAHQRSERTYNYGPSNIVKSVDLGNTKLYLCRYKQWYSLSMVKKRWIQWYTAGEDFAPPIDNAKPINFGWSYSNIKPGYGINAIFGYVTDSRINTIVLVDKSGKSTEEYILDENRMFLFQWTGEEVLYNYKNIVGLDKDGHEICNQTIY